MLHCAQRGEIEGEANNYRERTERGRLGWRERGIEERNSRRGGRVGGEIKNFVFTRIIIFSF